MWSQPVSQFWGEIRKFSWVVCICVSAPMRFPRDRSPLRLDNDSELVRGFWMVDSDTQFQLISMLLCAVRVPVEPFLTTAAACRTAVGSSLGSAGLPQ